MKTIRTLATVIMAILLHFPLSADDPATKENPQKETKSARGRPDHFLDLSWTGSDDGTSFARGFLDDRILTIGDNLPLRNMIRYDRTSTKHDGIPPHLYRFSDTIMAQNDDWLFVGRIGSSSDRLFHDSEALEAMIVGGMRIFHSGPHSLYGAILYSHENYFHLKYNVPIPFLFYGFKNDFLTASVGLPTFVFLKITPTLTFNFTFIPIFDIESGLKYRPLPFLSFGPEFIWKSDRYFITSPQPSDHRYYHEYLHLLVKVQSYITMNVGAYISGGYAFIDRYYDGKRSYDRHHIITEKQSIIANIGFQLFL